MHLWQYRILNLSYYGSRLPLRDNQKDHALEKLWVLLLLAIEASIKSDRPFFILFYVVLFNTSGTMLIASDISIALGSTAKALS